MTEGYVSCDEERMECLTSFFSGSVENIEYRFDSRGMREGEERRGRFLIVSNRGEYEVPFQVMVVHKELVSSEGELGNLFQFTNLARNSWEEAVKLFYSPDFLRVLGGQDRKYRNLYKGLSRDPEMCITRNFSFPCIRSSRWNMCFHGRKSWWQTFRDREERRFRL